MKKSSREKEHHMPANTPGGDRPAPRRKPAQYSRTAVAHVTSAGDWHGWEEMLDWLRSNGPSDPDLTPDELRGIRQDAERAAKLDIPFGTDTDGLWRALNQARQAHG